MVSALAQMAFLAMTVSIFTVVATVANNINSNNNNVNENNLNFVQQKENSLSMNQNIVNQINVDLPPPGMCLSHIFTNPESMNPELSMNLLLFFHETYALSM